jgi:MOSC domain-containing protein YiiM
VKDVDLPDGPGSPVVRGFAACLSSVLETPPGDLPTTGDEPLGHALSTWKSWLAGRGFGLVPIADPATFQWAGYWIAVVEGSDNPLADGHRQQMATLAFGTPPGIVLSPQDPSLLGRATADLAIKSAFAVASLNPVLPPPGGRTQMSGVVEQIAIAPAAEAPMQIITSSRAIPGRGLEGDRYAKNAGTFSPRDSHRPGYELTLIAAEVVDELTARDQRLDFASTRRNLLTRGIDVNRLVGLEFSIGEVRCRGLRLAQPCAHLERIAGPGLLRPLIHRGGVRVDILTAGEITPGSPITA